MEMKKIEIEFPVDFDGTTPTSIPLGRLIIGDAVCRLIFRPDGKVHLLCSSEAKKFIHFWPEQLIYGFGEKNEQSRVE